MLDNVKDHIISQINSQVARQVDYVNSLLPQLKIKDKIIKVPIVQGGMGVGVSLHPLAAAVAVMGAVGVISSACLDRLVSVRLGKKVDAYEAAYSEVYEARKSGGYVGMNIMVALLVDYEASVKGSLDAGVDAIISGAGLPLSLPSIQKPKDTALIPIVSSSRALELICRKWERLGYRPDAVVLEGPLAGGHLGFLADQVDLPENRLETLLPPVKDVAMKHGDFPVIAAGGIFTHEDIKRFLALGADGVQMGTRFVATNESGASDAYKQAVIDAKTSDIVVAVSPGSPCGLPFRVLKQSPMYASALENRRPPRCDKGYVLQKDSEGRLTKCLAKSSDGSSFCICNGLLSSGGYNTDREEPLYTVGATAERVDKIVSVKELILELTGQTA